MTSGLELIRHISTYRDSEANRVSRRECLPEKCQVTVKPGLDFVCFVDRIRAVPEPYTLVAVMKVDPCTSDCEVVSLMR